MKIFSFAGLLIVFCLTLNVISPPVGMLARDNNFETKWSLNVFEINHSEREHICQNHQNVPLLHEKKSWPLYIDPTDSTGNAALDKKTVKFLALYFPQWYPAPVNDHKDDWRFFQNPNFTHNANNVKMARPMNNAYYDSRCRELRRSQAALAKKFGLDGFVYYFYFVENEWVLSEVNQRMLVDGEPAIDFAFFWVNEEFAGLDVFYDSPERLAVVLLPFLTHPRYIRANGHPIFYIYAASNVPHDFIDRLQRKLEQNNVPRLYIVSIIQQWMNQLQPVSFADSYAEFPPNIGPLWHSYGYTRWNHSLDNYQLGMALNFDNTPRKAMGDPNRLPSVLSKGRSVPIFQPSPDEFFHRCVARVRSWYYRTTAEKAVLFFAWNEWSEQASLEPSDLHDYGYLEAVRKCRMSVAELEGSK